MATNEHYQAVIEDLERQRGELDLMIANMRRLAGMSTDSQSGTAMALSAVTAAPGGRTMRDDEFFGLGIVAAAKKYLGIVRQPTPAPVIARQLKAHGLLNNSKGFSGTVYSLLYRESEKPNGNLIKMPDNKWALAEWYPGMKRQKGKAADSESEGESTESGDSNEPGQPS